jgi:hypothetical protein
MYVHCTKREPSSLISVSDLIGNIGGGAVQLSRVRDETQSNRAPFRVIA